MTSDSRTTCSNHPKRSASWYCWNCGLPFCEDCVQPWEQEYICDSCRDALESATVEPASPDWPDNHRESPLVTRLLAFFIDFTLNIFVTLCLTWLMGHLMDLSTAQVQYLFWLVFYAGMVCRDGLMPGGSPGKIAVGLYVWNDDLNRPVSGIDSVRRNLTLLVFFLDVLYIPLNPRRRRVGDVLAGTLVCDRASYRDDRREILKLGGVVFTNVLLIFLLYAAWIHTRSTLRMTLGDVTGERTVTSENILSILREAGRRTARFDVERHADGITVVAETSTAAQYYEIKRKVTGLLREASYNVTAEPTPELVFRGPDDVFFRMQLKATQDED